MKRLSILAAAVLVLVALPAFAAEATFDRTLSVNGRVDLSISTGSGHIHLTQGPDNQVHVFGRVRSSWSANDDMVRQIAAHPPVEQTGSIIRIGYHYRNLHNISIEYDIEAPANAFLQAGSGSGDIADNGVGDNAKLTTGSGSIHATGLHGGFYLSTGSGDISAEQTGSGDVQAHTGSGTIDLHDIHGALRAGTGSGDIKISGSPTDPWHLHTGSGSIELWPGGTGYDLDASTGSGSIHSDQEMMTHGENNRHHLRGSVHGGGPGVRLETGSGDIRIH
ncbi:MAG: DUF4097 family beta strand repeat-containing protein [Terracidiphilus sp.]